MKNLIYAADKKLTDKDEQKIDDLIEYYMYEMNFGGQISWEDDGTFGDDRKLEFDLSKDEDFYKYIFYLEDDNSKVVDLNVEEKK